MKAFSVWKEVEIYKEALKKICSMMYDHDPLSLDYMSDTHQLEECCWRAGEALDCVRGLEKENEGEMKKPCVIEGCKYENTPGCRAKGLGVSGISECEKYASMCVEFRKGE